MKIKLKKLQLINFKGTRNLEINFSEETYIYGQNGSGKTTVFDAFTWLLFGKDSHDRSDFNVKTLNGAGEVIPKLDHEVIGVLDVDGTEYEFKRVLREKWVTKRGTAEPTFEGNETTYFIDGVPLKAKEYQDRISNIIDENLFKLITNPMAFNGIKWQDRRQSLINIVGDLSEEDILKGLDLSSDRKQTLLNILQSDQSVSDHKKRIAAEVKRNKDELKQIPARIDEAERSKPILPEGGLNSLKEELTEKQAELDKIDAQIKDGSKSLDGVTLELKKLKSQRYELESKRQRIEQDARRFIENQKTSSNEEEIKGLEKKRDYQKKVIEQTEIDIVRFRQDIANKRSEWGTVNAETFKDDQKCPTCMQNLPEAEINAAKDKFAKSKNERLQQIQAAGKDLAKRLEKEEEDLKILQAGLEEIEKKIKTLSQKQTLKPEEKPITVESILNEDAEIKKIDRDIDLINEEIKKLEEKLNSPNADEGLNATRQDLITSISKIQEELTKERELERAEKRIEELKKQEKELAQNIATAEKDLFLIDAYVKSKIDALEGKINARFKKVSFKMFEQQINGGESETCVCTVDGVPFSDLNTAMQINAGLDIIDTLSKSHEVYAPIFVDHRESVTNLLDVPTQVINLVVSPNDKELRIA